MLQSVRKCDILILYQRGTQRKVKVLNMELVIDVWNIVHNCQQVVIRSDGLKIFEGLMGDVPMKFIKRQVIWITSVNGVLIIDVLGE